MMVLLITEPPLTNFLGATVLERGHLTTYEMYNYYFLLELVGVITLRRYELISGLTLPLSCGETEAQR